MSAAGSRSAFSASASRWSTYGAPISSNGRVVPRPSDRFVPSIMPVPGYTTAVSTVGMFGEDATGTLTFEDSGLTADNSGATILEQAEAAGLSPEYGCRMGVCNTCAVKKNHGAVRHAISGEVSANTDETVKICVQVPVGDVSMAL